MGNGFLFLLHTGLSSVLAKHASFHIGQFQYNVSSHVGLPKSRLKS